MDGWAVFGSFDDVGVTAYYDVEQRRNGQVVWQGRVEIWNLEGTRPDLALPDGFEHGRREPKSSSNGGQWLSRSQLPICAHLLSFLLLIAAPFLCKLGHHCSV